MDFDLSEEQQMLRDVTRELLTRSYDITKLNQTVDAEKGWSADVWGQLAETGILGLGFIARGPLSWGFTIGTAAAILSLVVLPTVVMSVSLVCSDQ